MKVGGFCQVGSIGEGLQPAVQPSGPPHLLPVLPPGGVEALDEVGGVAQEHGVAGGAAHHAQHRQPHVRQRLWGEPVGEVEKHVGCLLTNLP